MLKNLVKKFKSHSLNDDGHDQQDSNHSDQSKKSGTEYPVTFATAQGQQFRRHCCRHKQTTCPHHHQRYQLQCQGSKSAVNDNEYDKDSGTESDEELEFIETNSTHSVPVSQTSDYYASQQSLSMNSCRSSHCGSPLLGLSDQECNSWESIGSESGINLRTRQHHHHQQHPQHPSHPPSLNFNYEFLLNPSRNRNNNSEQSSTPTMITEELPNHHYHTRQQFQRLKQQISMKNGEFVSHIQDNQTKTHVTTPQKEDSAFSPFSRFLPIGSEKKMDETGNDPLMAARRSRSSTLSTMSSSGVSTWSSSSSASSASSCSRTTVDADNSSTRGSWSEKRKWSQMREQKRQKLCNGLQCCCNCRECGNETAQNQPRQPERRTVLHAARKTPIKLLYPLVNGPGEEPKEVVSAEGTRDGPVGARKTRFSTRKKCRGDEDTKSEMDDCEEWKTRDMVKRPSLDFDKMRAKRNGIGKSKRSNSLSCSSMKSKLKEYHNSYHLRSMRRHHCFRPLDPPTSFVPVELDVSDQFSFGASGNWLSSDSFGFLK